MNILNVSSKFTDFDKILVNNVCRMQVLLVFLNSAYIMNFGATKDHRDAFSSKELQ